MANGITESDVWAAADALLLEGARPTIERVRQKIGRGSPNTVSPHLDAWFKALGGRIHDPGAFSAQGAPEHIIQAATQFWNAAIAAARTEQENSHAQARNQLAADRLSLNRRAEEMQQLHDRLVSREKDLEEGILVARQHASATEKRLAQTEARLVEREKQIGQLQERLSDAQAALAEQSERAERLRAEQLEKLNAAEARHAVHERKWMTSLDAERTTVKRLEAEVRKLTREVDEGVLVQRASAERTKTLERDVKRAAELTAAQQHRHDAAIQQMEGRWASQLKALEHRASRAEALLDRTQISAQEREKDLQNRLDTAQGQISKLLIQLKAKDDVIHEVTARLDKRSPSAN